MLSAQHSQHLAHLAVVRSLRQWSGLRASTLKRCSEISPPTDMRKPMLRGLPSLLR
jgi:hypothetical protein